MTELALAIATTEFDRTTAVTPSSQSPGWYEVDLSELWLSLVGIHGGYQAAISVQAATAAVPGRPVRTLSTSFIRSAQPGPASLRVQELRRGRTASTVTAELWQRGELRASTRLTMIEAGTDGVAWAAPAPVSLPSPEHCEPLNPPNRVVHFERAEGRLDPATIPFTGGDQARIAGWIRPLEARPIDAAWLAMAADWFPPPAFVRVEPPTGGISVDLTTHIHRPITDLGDGWLAGTFEITESAGGLAVEHGRITTDTGFMVAESFHTRLTAVR
ncbi:MAG: thioesterase family protein [Acidimicrobiales bacterium]